MMSFRTRKPTYATPAPVRHTVTTLAIADRIEARMVELRSEHAAGAHDVFPAHGCTMCRLV